MGQSGSISDAVDVAKKTVVPIVCVVRVSNGKDFVKYRKAGSGFLVGRAGTFVTATHVINSLSGRPRKDACQGAITFSIGEGKSGTTNVKWLALPAGEWEAPKHSKWFTFEPRVCYVSGEFDVSVCQTLEILRARRFRTTSRRSLRNVPQMG
jgi:hypothetical protein